MHWNFCIPEMLELMYTRRINIIVFFASFSAYCLASFLRQDANECIDYKQTKKSYEFESTIYVWTKKGEIMY